MGNTMLRRIAGVFMVPFLASVLTTASPLRAAAVFVLSRDLTGSDDVPSVSWITNIYGASESEGSTVVMIHLETSSDATVLVDYTTSDLSAKAGIDYTAIRGTAIFTPGQEYVTLPISLTRDLIAEPCEDFALTLSNPVHARLHYSEAIVRIHDGDRFRACDDRPRYGVILPLLIQ